MNLEHLGLCSILGKTLPKLDSSYTGPVCTPAISVVMHLLLLQELEVMKLVTNHEFSKRQVAGSCFEKQKQHRNSPPGGPALSAVQTYFIRLQRLSFVWVVRYLSKRQKSLDKLNFISHSYSSLWDNFYQLSSLQITAEISCSRSF